jgi:transcriptional regulator with XRE-family HTH domain
MVKAIQGGEPLLGVQLKNARIERNLTQSKLSKLSGISRKHISDAERGDNISVRILVALMRALGLKQVRLGDDATAAAKGMDQEVLLAIAVKLEELEREASSVIRAGATFIRTRVQQASDPRHARREEETRERAAALVRHLSESLINAAPEQIEALEATLFRGAPPARHAAASRRRRAS